MSHRRLQVVPVGLGAGLVCGLVDAAFAFVRGPFEPGFVLVAAGVFALFGLLAALPLRFAALALYRLGERVWPTLPPRRAVVVAVMSTAVAVGALTFAISTTVFTRDTPAAAHLRLVWPLALLLVLALVELGWLVRVFTRRPRAASLVAGLLLAGGAALTPRFFAATATTDLRWAVVLFAYLASLAGLEWGFARGRLARRAGLSLSAVGVVVGIVGGGLLVAQPQMRLISARYAAASDLAVRWLGRAADVDADGYSPLSGEGDCAPFDGAIHPFAVEVAGNELDEDCHGGDLDPELIRPFAAVPSADPPQLARPDLILITVDTLRPDHLGIYGYPRDTSPHLDAFFADAVVFERAYSSSPVTDRALPVMLAGNYPSMFTEALEWDAHVLDDRRELFFERLKAAGYHTSALVTADAVREHGLDQGIDLLEDVPRPPGARRVTARAIRELRSLAKPGDGRPFALWLHYFDPHGPYEAPPQHRKWDDGGPSTDANRTDRYDGEIHYVDHEIGEFLAALDREQLADDALVIFGADHGEEFLDHGGWYHAEELYDESVRVPWLIRLPAARRADARSHIGETVGLVDFMPTVLELLDIEPPSGIVGRSQAAAVRGEGPVDAHPIFLEQFEHKTSRVQKIGVVDGQRKLILDLENQLWELYELADDPRELTNAYGRDTAVTLHLRDLLLDYWSRVQAARAAGIALGGG